MQYNNFLDQVLGQKSKVKILPPGVVKNSVTTWSKFA